MTIISLKGMSPEADDFYRKMVQRMDASGFIGTSECLELSVELFEEHELPRGGMKRLLAEIESDALAFAVPEMGGWYVRLPVRPQ